MRLFRTNHKNSRNLPHLAQSPPAALFLPKNLPDPSRGDWRLTWVTEDCRIPLHSRFLGGKSTYTPSAGGIDHHVSYRLHFLCSHGKAWILHEDGHRTIRQNPMTSPNTALPSLGIMMAHGMTPSPSPLPRNKTPTPLSNHSAGQLRYQQIEAFNTGTPSKDNHVLVVLLPKELKRKPLKEASYRKHLQNGAFFF